MNIPCNISPLGSKEVLPAGYTLLAFIEAPQGGAGINLEYVPTAGTGFRTEFEITDSIPQYQHVLSSGEVIYRPDGSVEKVNAVVYTPHFNNAAYRLFAAKYLEDGTSWRYAPTGAFPIKRRLQAEFNWMNDSRLRFPEQTEQEIPVGLIQRTGVQTWLFSCPGDPKQSMYGRIYSAAISEGRRMAQNLVPAVDRNGECCMVDTIHKRTYRSHSGALLVAGVGTVDTLAALLNRLPATGGELTLSLPAEANTPEVAEALQACHDTKGWTLTVHEYRPAAAATYSLRRVRSVVWCRCEQAEYGAYVSDGGTRWQVDRCAAIFGPNGQDPADYGYTPFDSVEAAAEQWGLKEDTIPLPQSE